ncbi:MAG TPA: hypothetical protein PLJ27_26365, partial [Polyangiaceae bacterium]|nr:hypothetical protein [Polyangiaceae bacterium]
ATQPADSVAPLVSAPAGVMMPKEIEAVEGQVPSSTTLDDLRWIAGYRFAIPRDVPVGVRWTEAREACEEIGLDLCTEEQWHLACRVNPVIAERKSWTITPGTGEAWVTRGGGEGGCGVRGNLEASSAEAGMIGLCCERRASLSPGKRAPAVLAEADMYIRLVETALNSRDPSTTTDLMADPGELFGTMRSHEEASKALRWTYNSWGKMDSRFTKCDVNIQMGQGHFTCETVMTRNRKGGPGLELTVFRQRYEYGPPAQKYHIFGKTTETIRKWKAL